MPVLEELLKQRFCVSHGLLAVVGRRVELGMTEPTLTPFDDEVFGAGILVGLDPRYAIQRFVNVSAAYNGIEEFVMRKATGFRVDYGEMSTRLYDEAWSVLSLEV